MTGLPRDGQHPDPVEAIAAIPGAAAGWAGSDWGAAGMGAIWTSSPLQGGFFFPLKSMLQSWLLSQHGCITGIPELLAGSGGRRGLPGSLSTRCNFTTRLEVESSLTN